jgi:glycosyltransferase involved in cell wall biosynthesis
LVRDRGIDVVHQPYPVSPAEPSLIHSVGAPVVIGPMNGGLDYPPGLRDQENRWESAAVELGRRLRDIATRLVPGKREARILLVVNRRTRDHLPRSIRGEVIELVENGVDLATWSWPGERGRSGGPTRFIYLGRLINWKGIDLLLKAWASLRPPFSGQLMIIGDGPLRATLEALRDRLGLTHSVEFAGFLPQEECVRRLADADVLILPSLIESGGNVVLEAMAMGLPVIATDWGGPADYLDASCGILVPPGSRASFIAGLAEAIARLDRAPELRRAMGQAARRRVAAFSWDEKIDRILEIYRRAAGRDEQTDAGDPSRGDVYARDARGAQ